MVVQLMRERTTLIERWAKTSPMPGDIEQVRSQTLDIQAEINRLRHEITTGIERSQQLKLARLSYEKLKFMNQY